MPRGRRAKKNATQAEPLGGARTTTASVPRNAASWEMQEDNTLSLASDWSEAFLQALNRSHILTLLAFAAKSNLLKNLKIFTFSYRDVSRDAANSSRDLTEEALIRLAQACPSLTRVEIPGLGDKVTSATIVNFFAHCPELRHLEITGISNCDHREDMFNWLRDRTDWAPKIKTLVVDEIEKAKMLKAMRDMSRAREKLEAGKKMKERWEGGMFLG
ncbi:hypothetical protein OQA88_2572 [Cercophora sp. LCS_1]